MPDIPPLRIAVTGEVSTAHRPRYSGTDRRGRPIMRLDAGYRRWKDRCASSARSAKAAWESRHGRRWPTEGVRYAVRCLALLEADRKDADSCGRGFRDACEGVLWRNDKACRPVIDDCERVPDGHAPGLLVDIIAYDPAEDILDVRIERCRRS